MKYANASVTSILALVVVISGLFGIIGANVYAFAGAVIAASLLWGRHWMAKNPGKMSTGGKVIIHGFTALVVGSFLFGLFGGFLILLTHPSVQEEEYFADQEKGQEELYRGQQSDINRGRKNDCYSTYASERAYLGDTVVGYGYNEKRGVCFVRYNAEGTELDSSGRDCDSILSTRSSTSPESHSYDILTDMYHDCRMNTYTKVF